MWNFFFKKKNNTPYAQKNIRNICVKFGDQEHAHAHHSALEIEHY